MSEDDIDWDELGRQQEEQRRQFSEQSLAELKRALRSERGFRRLEAISEEEWQAAIEADAREGQEPEESKRPVASERAGTRRPEVIEMTCPLCGHNEVKRYPYQRYGVQNGWQYVCQGCNRAFDPELEC